MNISLRTPEPNHLGHAGSIQDGDVVWQVIKAIQSVRAGHTQIIIRDTSIVEIRTADELCPAKL